VSIVSLPTPWNLYNLTGSPFFQGVLEDREHTQRPLTLFVGRKNELARMRTAIHGAGAQSSRHAIAGGPGVGKTTLVQELKATLRDDGYLASASHVHVLPDDTAGSLFIRILAAVYEILLLARPHLIDNDAMQQAQALVRVTRERSTQLSVSVAGFGLGGGRSQTMHVPPDPMADGPRVLRALMALVATSDARGVILHLNNLENLSDAASNAAADILRSLRDPVFQQDGLHTLVVGTVDAVQAAVNKHAQMRSVFTTVLVDPLPLADVLQLLQARYAVLRREASRPVAPPVATAAVDTLYGYFRGDLRGLLKALDEGAAEVIGLRLPAEGAAAVWPALTLADMLPGLQQRARTQLRAEVPGRMEHLDRWGAADPAAAHTQQSLTTLWGLSQAAVSVAVDHLQKAGYIVPLGLEGRRMRYGLSGTSRLIYG